MYRREAIEVTEHDARGVLDGAAEALCIRLLGGFWVSVGGQTLDEDEWRLRKAAALIKLLALAPRHRLHREWIMETLWPELSPRAAANNLRFTLHNARRTLESALPDASRCLRLRHEQLALCPEGGLRTDVEAFEEAADVSRRARDPTAYEAAVGLYAGDLLPEDCYEEWAEGRRGELRTTYLALLLELAKLHEERAELESAVEALRRVVRSEPAHEGAHAGLMRLYALSGQHQGALRQYERLRDTLRQALDTEPDATSRRLYEEILAGRLPTIRAPRESRPGKEPPIHRQHNLPAVRREFVGREQGVVEVDRALETTRLLTLTGACGSGKTRLALEVGRGLIGAYPDGVWLVELAELPDPELVPQAVAEALGVRVRPDRSPIGALVDALRTKKTLLILDNCEHLVVHVARTVDALLDSCPLMRMLTTSQAALGVAGEIRWPVPPLPVPDPRRPSTIESLVRFGSVRLFLERVRCHHPGFVLTPRNVGAVAEICRRLEGNPLAIELAASRVRVLSVDQIAAGLSDPLKLLTTGDRTMPPRQQTLRGALNRSYELLDEQERRLFNRLSVCADSWTLETAEEVGTGDGIVEDNCLDLLSGLVNKSLVVAEANGDGAVRFRMLDLVRQYGRERLEETGEYDTFCQQHAASLLESAEADEPESNGSAGALRQATGRGSSPVERPVDGSHASTVRVRLDESSREEAWAQEQMRTLERAIESTLSREWHVPITTPEEPPSDGRSTPLTRREREVAALVGQGLTNRQISARLVLSEHTVAAHVRKILRKLGFHSRAQIATRVAERRCLRRVRTDDPPSPDAPVARIQIEITLF